MGLATRVIPILLHRKGQLVKGRQFNADRVVGHALQAARVHAARHVDELIVLDIGATPEKRGPDFAAIKELTRDCFCPLTVGGGVRNVEDVRRLLAAGADKVAIGAASHDDPQIINQASQKFGNQAIVAVVDCDQNHNIKPRFKAMNWCIEMQYWGAGEILLQSIDRDGTMVGYDLELIRSVSAAVDVPVIACGGCSGYEDMANAIRAGASAVAVGALFAFTEATPRGAVEYLQKAGIETRIPA